MSRKIPQPIEQTDPVPACTGILNAICFGVVFWGTVFSLFYAALLR